MSLANKLADLTHQLQEFIHTIAESKHCALQSLALELKLGEIKVREGGRGRGGERESE